VLNFKGLMLSYLQWPVFMGIEHERVHIETSSVLIRQLPVAMVTTPPGWNYAPTEPGLISTICTLWQHAFFKYSNTTLIEHSRPDNRDDMRPVAMGGSWK